MNKQTFINLDLYKLKGFSGLLYYFQKKYYLMDETFSDKQLFLENLNTLIAIIDNGNQNTLLIKLLQLVYLLGNEFTNIFGNNSVKKYKNKKEKTKAFEKTYSGYNLFDEHTEDNSLYEYVRFNKNVLTLFLFHNID